MNTEFISFNSTKLFLFFYVDLRVEVAGIWAGWTTSGTVSLPAVFAQTHGQLRLGEGSPTRR